MTDDFYQLQKHAPSPEELIAGAGKNFVVLTAFERQRRAINRQWAQMHGASDTTVPQLRVRDHRKLDARLVENAAARIWRANITVAFCGKAAMAQYHIAME